MAPVSRIPLRALLLAVLALASAAARDAWAQGRPIATIQRDAPVDFEREILPILAKNCLACHSQSAKKGNLVLETPQSILKGGDLGAAAVAGNSGESLLLQVAAHLEEPIMPPEDNKVGANPLSPEELGLIKLWIDQGAKGEVLGLGGPVQWQPLPPGINPIYATAITPDGQYAAASRANQIFIYHVASGRLAGRLTDPALIEAGIYERPGVAHLDLVQSLAFSPDGERLASGGFRTVKIWRRQRDARRDLAATDEPARSIAVSADGKRCAIGQQNGAIRLVDLESGNAERVLTGHEGAVTGLVFSADGATLYSASADKSLRAWNTADGELIRRIDGPAPIHALALVSAGKQLATGDEDNVIRIWDIEPPAPAEGQADQPAEDEAPKPAKELRGHSGPVTSLAVVDAEGKQLLSGGRDNRLRHWNIEAGNQVREMDHGGPVADVAVRPDGKRFVSAGENKTVRLWNAENGQQVAEIKGDHAAQFQVARLTREVAALKSRVEDRKKAIPAAEETAKKEQEAVAKAKEGKDAAEKTLGEKREAVKKPTEEKDAADKELAVALEAVKKAMQDKQDAEQQATDATSALEKATAAKQVADKAAGDAQNAFNAATQAKNNAAQAAEQAANELKQKTDAVAAAKAELDQNPEDEGKKNALAAAEQARIAAEKNKTEKDAALQAAEKALADADAKNKAAQEAKTAAEKALADANKANQDAQQAKNKANQDLQGRENEQKQVEQKVKQKGDELKKAVDELTGAEAAMLAAAKAFEAAEAVAKRAAEAIPAAQAVLQALEQRVGRSESVLDEAKKRSEQLEQPLRAAAFSPDGALLAVAGDSGLIHVYSSENGTPVDALTGHQDAIDAIAFTPAGRLISAARNKAAIAWEVGPAWVLERTIGSPDDPSLLVDRVLSLDFSPDGKLLASGSGLPSRSGELKLWNVDDGQLVREMKDPHSDTIYGLDFSGDGDLIASAAADRFVKVFRVSDGHFVRSFEGHTNHVLDVAWRSDGRRLASCGADNAIKIWDYDTGEQRRTIQNYTKEVTSITFIGDSDQVVSCSGDRNARVHTADNGNNVRSFSGAGDFLYSIAISEDGKIVLAGGQDSVLRVWNGENAQSMINFDPPAAGDTVAASK